MAATYRVVPGTFSVTPVKSSYTTDEEVELRIKCTMERKDGAGALFAWSGDFYIYDANDKLLAQETDTFWTTSMLLINQGIADFTKKIGRFSAGTLTGYVVAKAHG